MNAENCEGEKPEMENIGINCVCACNVDGVSDMDDLASQCVDEENARMRSVKDAVVTLSAALEKLEGSNSTTSALVQALDNFTLKFKQNQNYGNGLELIPMSGDLKSNLAHGCSDNVDAQDAKEEVKVQRVVADLEGE